MMHFILSLVILDIIFLPLKILSHFKTHIYMEFQTDMQVRDKILILVDSWQAAFGGPSGKHTQYYWAYDELRVCI